MKFMLNCDMGETEVVEDLGHDMKCLDFVHMANIASGGHAGSDEVMIEVLKACKAKSVLPGAHPSYPDRHNFGRTTIPAITNDIRHWTHEQVLRLAKHASSVGVTLHHIKPHGALYHDTMNNFDIAEAFILGVLSALNDGVAIVGQPGSKLEQVCIHEGLPFLSEAFADRKYLPNGALQPRSIPGSVLNTNEAITQMKSIIETGHVISTEGPIPIRFDTVCVHGDSPDALSILQSIRQL